MNKQLQAVGERSRRNKSAKGSFGLYARLTQTQGHGSVLPAVRPKSGRRRGGVSQKYHWIHPDCLKGFDTRGGYLGFLGVPLIPN